MAGTRYRARFVDADARSAPAASSQASQHHPSHNHHRHHLSALQAATPIPVDDSADEEQASMPEVAESIASDSASSSRPASSAIGSTEGFCTGCQTKVGEFYNAWHKITGTYFLPALAGSYSHLLNQHGKQKPASKGTVLEGCSIQPLSCPARHCVDTLGIAVVDAPEGKHSFRGRVLFKLSRIELRCKVSANKTTVVDPHLEPFPEPLAIKETQAQLVQVPSPVPDTIPPPTDAMEVDTRPPPLHSGPHNSRHEQHHELRHHQHQPLQTVEANRQTLPPPSIRSPPGAPPLHSLSQKSPSNPPPPLPSPAVKSIHDAPYTTQPPTREASIGATNTSRDLPPVTAHSRSPGEQNRPNGQYYPRPPQDVQLDAIERLQTQISQNSGALAAQSRDMRRYEETQQHTEDNLRREFQSQLHHQNSEIRRMDDAVRGLQHELGGIRELIEGLRRDVHASRAEVQTPRGMSVAPAASGSAQDSALELMAQQIAVISHKANEVDTLKITIEIMKNKIQRLEDAGAAAPGAPSSAHPFQSPREPSAHSTHSSHTVPTYHNTPSAVPHINPPVHPSQRTQPYHGHGAQSVTATPEMQRAEPPQSSSGWVTVNSAAKRAHQNSIDSPHDSIGQSIGSPKRQKLTTIEPRVGYAGSQGHPQHGYDHMDTDDSEGRMQTHSHTLPSQAHMMPDAAHASHASAYVVPYGTQDAPSDESWRADAQRIIEHRPRGRGRGGGPGSRGGRGRKSLPTQVHVLSTPEWEKEEWHGTPEMQGSPEGYYSHVGRPRGIARRGSGGSGGTTRGGRPSSSSDRAVSLGLQGVTTGVGIGLPADPYAHTKKTRTKPTRNADGILIRKDGRPDMRSQSSAANLRKVHARKEEQKGTERGFTPSNLHHTTAATPETPSPSPTGYMVQGQDVTASVQKKHNAIMGKMFPGGVDESRKEHDYSRKVFEEEQDHTAHPRSQNHTHQSARSGPARRDLKDEHAESPNDGDVDMDRADDQADDEGQTPGQQSDNSEQESQYRDPQNYPEPARQEPKANGVQPLGSIVASSATVTTESPMAS